MLDAVATTGNGMTLPSLKTPLASPTNVYESKNKDRHPHIRAVSVLPAVTPTFFFFFGFSWSPLSCLFVFFVTVPLS